MWGLILLSKGGDGQEETAHAARERGASLKEKGNESSALVQGKPDSRIIILGRRKGGKKENTLSSARRGVSLNWREKKEKMIPRSLMYEQGKGIAVGSPLRGEKELSCIFMGQKDAVSLRESVGGG